MCRIRAGAPGLAVALFLTAACGRGDEVVPVSPAPREAPAATDAAPLGVVTSGRVTLLSRTKYGADASEFLLREGLTYDRGRGWDLTYGARGDDLFVSTVGGTIRDVGAASWEAVSEIPPRPTGSSHEDGPRATAVEGHLFLVHTESASDDHWSLVRVTRLVPGDRCEIEWVRWVRSGPAPLPLALATMERLPRVFASAEKAHRAERRAQAGTIRDPEAVSIQVRTASRGGNEVSVNLLSTETTRDLPRRSEPMRFEVPRPEERGHRSDPDPGFFVNGGSVPEGQAFVVEAIDVFADAPGDSNGHGEVRFELGTQVVTRLEDGSGPMRTWYVGRAVIRPGDENRVRVTLANSSCADVRLRGRFAPLEKAAHESTTAFEPSTAPSGVLRAGTGVGDVPSEGLAGPRVLIQIRAGAGGGNPNRVSMLGKASQYLDRMSTEPVASSASVSSDERSVGYFVGGRIPAGKIFVVTRVVYEGTAAGDSNGHGEFLVEVGGKEVVHARNRKDWIAGVWTGEIPIRRGQEPTLFAEVANSSTADVTFEGRFENER